MVVAFLTFVALYALLVSITSDLREVIDRVMTVVLISAGVILMSALLFVVIFTMLRGWQALTNVNFFFQDMEFAGPLDGLDVGGVAHAIMGTLIQISIALAISIPLGIVTALFLNEIGGRFARFVRTIVDAMTALPSIVAGLFIYSAFILLFTHQRSGFAAALAITVMMLPIIIRASDVVLRLVAGNLREASYALGASRWRTVWHVVLPTARSGLVTAIILGTARGIGETSPVLLTSGITNVMNLNPFEGPMISLPCRCSTSSARRNRTSSRVVSAPRPCSCFSFSHSSRSRGSWAGEARASCRRGSDARRSPAPRGTSPGSKTPRPASAPVSKDPQ